MSAARMCRVFNCDARGDRYCCRDCNGYDVCANHCLNHPSRCRLVQDPDRKGARASRTKSSSPGAPES